MCQLMTKQLLVVTPILSAAACSTTEPPVASHLDEVQQAAMTECMRHPEQYGFPLSMEAWNSLVAAGGRTSRPPVAHCRDFAKVIVERRFKGAQAP